MEATKTAAQVRAGQIPPEATRLVALAAEQAVPLRVTGSVAVHLHCERHRSLMPQLGRRPFYDIDFWGRDRDHQRIQKFLLGQGYVADPAARGLREWGIKRQIFAHPRTGIKIDVFLDRLVMAHTLDFAARLELDTPCVPVADLLLSKLQIHELTANDLIDLIVLVGEHDPTGTNLARLLEVLCDDWGFWYSADLNLAALDGAVQQRGLDADLVARVRQRVAALRAQLDEAPKSRRWRKRAKVGSRKQWYEQVDEIG